MSPRALTRISRLAVVAAACGIAMLPLASGVAEDDAAPTFGVKIPGGYRQWAVIAVTHSVGFDELKAILGNPTAIKAHRDGTLPFPDGTVLAKLSWKREKLPDFDVFVAGAPTKLEVMVKDSRKYAATGGWGFGRFIDGKPADEAQHKTCFPCHDEHAKPHDWVFTRFAP